MPDSPSVSTRVKTAIAAYEREQSEIAQEAARILQLRKQIEETQVFEIGLLKRTSGCADPVEPVIRYSSRRLIRLSADGGPSNWAGDYHPNLARVSEIAAVPLHALLMSWVVEQERDLERRRVVWQARDLAAEILAAVTVSDAQ